MIFLNLLNKVNSQTHFIVFKDWSIMLESTEQSDDRRRARPKTDVNAPDLYIPTVAFVTYDLYYICFNNFSIKMN